MEYINTMCGQNAALFNVKSGGAYSYHCALNELIFWEIMKTA
jgi:hypothetical protein